MYGCTPQTTAPITGAQPTGRQSRATVISPVSRVNAPLHVELEITGGKVSEARVGGRCRRDLESLLKGRNPRELVQLAQRADGEAPCAPALASALAVEKALGAAVSQDARAPSNVAVWPALIQAHIRQI